MLLRTHLPESVVLCFDTHRSLPGKHCYCHSNLRGHPPESFQNTSFVQRRYRPLQVLLSLELNIAASAVTTAKYLAFIFLSSFIWFLDCVKIPLNKEAQ